MATRKRPTSRSRLLKRAVKAGRSAFREAEKRVPPDVRKQVERRLKDGQKVVDSALKQFRTQLNRTARQTDLDAALKRIDQLSRQVQELARTARGAAAPAARPARRTAKRAAAGARKAAGRAKSAAASTAKKAAPRRRAKTPRVVVTPPSVETPPMVIPDPDPREPNL